MRLTEFWPQVPRLFRQAQGPVHEAYQRLLYHVEHAFQPHHLAAVEHAFGLPHPDWTETTQRQAIAALDQCRYPDAAAMMRFAKVPGLTLGHVSHYLHFFHHAYPIYNDATLAGLRLLGLGVPGSLPRDPPDADAYHVYVATLDRLKEAAPFRAVPETNVFLTRIIQGALEGLGASQPGR